MTVLFHPDPPRLRLDPESFAALHAFIVHSEAGVADPDALAELCRHRVVVGGALHPRMEPCWDALQSPLCRLRIRDHYRDGKRWYIGEADAWIGRLSVALLVARLDGLSDVVALPVMRLPEVLARMVWLGPRPRPDGPPLQVASELLDGVVSADPALRSHAVRKFIATVSAAPTLRSYRANPRDWAVWLLEGLQRRWDAVMRWEPAAGAVGKREIRVLDSDSGMWLVEPTGARVTRRPTTTTAVWRAMVQLLPQAGELDTKSLAAKPPQAAAGKGSHNASE